MSGRARHVTQRGQSRLARPNETASRTTYSLVKDGTLAKHPFRSGATLSRGRARDFTGSRGQAIAGASGVLRPQASRPVAHKRDRSDGANAPEHVSRTGSAGVGCTVHRLGAGATPPSGPSRQALALREHLKYSPQRDGRQREKGRLAEIGGGWRRLAGNGENSKLRAANNQSRAEGRKGGKRFAVLRMDARARTFPVARWSAGI